MKFNIVRAWKDEAYRQTLSEEQLSALPANPAGELELTSADLETVYGGGGPAGIAGFPNLPGVPRSDYALAGQYLHSFALFCNDAEFSITVVKSVNVASPITVICINSDDIR